MKYFSTNNKSPMVHFEKALLQGQAPDLGLYFPIEIPRWETSAFQSLHSTSYPEIAYQVMKEFIRNEIPERELIQICNESYSFPVPLEEITSNRWIMRLDQGPTASFKDFAARMMARMFSYFLQKNGEKRIILVATSGDTGSAIAHAFHRVEGIEVVVVFPEKEVTPRQRKQMTTLGENIHPIALKGKFDDCQAFVKQAFSDKTLSGLPLSSANSINIGRLIPQAVYYIYAYSRLFEKNENISISIPSGNFGNMMGCMIAKRMGTPIRHCIVAVNENDVFPQLIKTHEYHKIDPSKDCLSNAMNVGHPSNLPRLLSLFGGKMDEKGLLLLKPHFEELETEIFATSVTDEETRKTIVRVFQQWKTLLEPHGAVGWKGADRFLEKNPENKDLLLCVETAHPSKFPESLKELIEIDPVLPYSLKDIDSKTETYATMEKEYFLFHDFLQSLRETN